MPEKSLLKKVRGVGKNFVPYCLQSRWVREHYGVNPIWDRPSGYASRNGWVRLLKGVAPYGLVKWYFARVLSAKEPEVRRLCEKLKYFDRAWYNNRYPDVAKSGIDPLEHYFTRGWKERRDPSERFSTGGYLHAYPDILINGINPLLHYVRTGRWEGREPGAPGPFFETPPTWYDRRICARKEKDPLVSVVVASYNYEDLVVETLESLVAQTYRNFEIVVVDDGSVDKSRRNIRKFIEKHRRCGIPIALYTHRKNCNRGLPETVRVGVERSRGKFVAFCESDDLWTPDHLQKVVDLVNRYADPKIIVNDCDIFGDARRVNQFELIRSIRYRELRRTKNSISPAKFRKMNFLLTFSCTMVERELLLGCDFNPVARPAALDWWLWRQICFKNPVFFVNEKLTRWRMHDSYMFKTHTAEKKCKTLEELQDEFNVALDDVMRRRYPWTAWRGIVKPSATSGVTATYDMSAERKRRFLADRATGLRESAQLVRQNAGARILVCLHLFYQEAWPTICAYLENLRPYAFDLVVTCAENRISDKVLESVRTSFPSVRIVQCENAGFDVGPFVEVLNTIDLSQYDIVFKLQSKGIRRPSIFIYGQVFKYTDWFYNLFEGVLNGRNVHLVIDALLHGDHKIAAASNLLVTDPRHKQFFVNRWCGQMGVPYVPGYKYVAGTCFAIRARDLLPLQRLRLHLPDFGQAKPGEFSLAHFIERWMCFATPGTFYGTTVNHPVYKAEVSQSKAVSALRLLEDRRFKLDYDWFYRAMEMERVRRYAIVDVKLGDITRYWHDGELYPLSACAPYKYLNGDKAAYTEYCRENAAVSGFEMSSERFETLKRGMEKFDPLCMPVVIGPRNVIHDGQHRCCILLKKYGPDHKIKVLRIN